MDNQLDAKHVRRQIWQAFPSTCIHCGLMPELGDLAKESNVQYTTLRNFLSGKFTPGKITLRRLLRWLERSPILEDICPERKLLYQKSKLQDVH